MGETQREVLEITPRKARVIEHRFLERECALCGTRENSAVDIGERVLGSKRLGIGLISLIVTLREVGSLKVRNIEAYLEKVHQLHLSVGAITAASQRVALAAAEEVTAISDQISASAAVMRMRAAGAPRGAMATSGPSARSTRATYYTGAAPRIWLIRRWGRR